MRVLDGHSDARSEHLACPTAIDRQGRCTELYAVMMPGELEIDSKSYFAPHRRAQKAEKARGREEYVAPTSPGFSVG